MNTPFGLNTLTELDDSDENIKAGSETDEGQSEREDDTESPSREG
jgi:hypothetical protein